MEENGFEKINGQYINKIILMIKKFDNLFDVKVSNKTTWHSETHRLCMSVCEQRYIKMFFFVMDAVYIRCYSVKYLIQQNNK